MVTISLLNRMQKELSQLRKGETSLDEYYPKEVAPVVDDLNALFFYQELLNERAIMLATFLTR